MFKRIVSLRYHSIEPEGSWRITEGERFYNVTPENFRKQMAYLKENGFTALSLSDLLRIEDEKDLPKKPVILTFDDGHISHYGTALPILKEAGLSGVFFIVVDEVAKNNRMGWRWIKALRSAGMEIGSHSLHHTALNKAPYQSLIVELKASKLELESHLGEKILAFSVPTGIYSRKISNVARGMGYKLVFTSFIGNITLNSDPHCLRRIGMRNEYTMDDFVSIVGKDTGFLLKKHMEQFATASLKNTIGVKGYERLKHAIL